MSVEANPHNHTNMNLIFSQFVAANFFKKESRSPRGFLPSPLLRAGESVAPPPLPQKKIVAGRIISDFASWICVSDLAK